MPDKPSVLFVCVHNAGRSQMAAGFLRELGGDRVEVLSAGSAPKDQINPVAVEAMAAGLAIDLRDPIQPGTGSRAALDLLRQHVPGPGPDRFLAPELAAVTELLSDGSLLGAAQERVGAFE